MKELSLKQIFTVMMCQKIWEFSDEQFEQLWKIFKEVNKEWIQQKHEYHDKNCISFCHCLDELQDELLEELK